MANLFAADDNNIIERFSKIFGSKHQADDVNSTINEEDLNQLAGRVTQGSNEADFEYLQKNTDKKFAWVMGGDGLKLFLKQSNIQVLRSIGGEDRWIRKRLEIGRRFRLGIFYKSDQCVPATWDGILSLIDKHYSKSISTKICQHADALKSMSFDEIEDRARLSFLEGASYFDVNELPVNGIFNDSRFMTEERFSECQGTLEESRGFLYNRIGLTGLFDGSGFTKDSTGQLHVREYLQLNLLVRDLPGFRYLDISIDTNDLMPDV
jgi:hypothetical protein